MSFRRASIAVALLLLGGAGCGEEGETFTIRTRLIHTAGVSDPPGGLDRVRSRVLQDAAVAGARELAPGDAWTLPVSGVDAARPVVIRVEGLDPGGAVVRAGGTRPLVPRAAQGLTSGILFSTPGESAALPSVPAVARQDAGVLALPDAGGVDRPLRIPTAAHPRNA